MQRHWHILMGLILLASAGLGVGVQPALAAGVVGTGTPGSCDEAALETAPAGGGLVTFNCGPAPHTIGLTSEKVISIDTEIDGGGWITLDGQGQTRIFYVNEDISFGLTAIALTGGNGSGSESFGRGGAIYSDGGILTITNSSLSGNIAILDGGAIYSDNGATLTITDSTISGNTGDLGGAIYSGEDTTATITGSTLDGNATDADGGGIAVRSGATLMLTDSAITNSANISSFNADGGGIHNIDGDVTITSSTISGNIMNGHGGGIFNLGGAVTVINSVIRDNQATDASSGGGGVYNWAGGNLIITNSSINDNLAGDRGGGINNFGATASVTDSTVDGNQSGDHGGGIANNSTLTVTNSTISNNVLFPFPSTSIGFGGGVYNASGATATLTNSTISGNTANFGGGIYNSTSSLTLIHSTISGNALVADNGGFGSGSGIYHQGSSNTLTVQNSIVANSIDGANCFDNSGTITSAGGNLSDDDSCPFGQPSDLPDTEDGLASLADNGGPTETHLPQAGSAAIDNALAANCPDADQRGISRPQGPGCDIGSVERVQGATYLLCVNYYTGAVTSPLSGDCGPGTAEITPFDKSFCLHPWTGQVQHLFGRACTAPRFAHTMPDDGDLLTCVSLYTGINRWVANHSRCSAYELPNTIPAAP